MTFQTSDYKETNFLDLLDNKYLSIKPTYIKDGTWLSLLGYSNILCARAIRAITNYAPIGKYWLRFFPKESSEYLCRLYLIKLRHHILHKYRRFNDYWNLYRKLLKYFVNFLKFNLGAFSFHKGIT